ncbi:hypothetical protein AB5J62_33435 [Amycolatopsis sp. cg5]|uniref:hypothetical protein n=1 Tax=Amycolatopsis sp. cg5 TaxID=3238802 RepID=UPI0035253343
MVDAPDLDWALKHLKFRDLEHHPVFGPLVEQLLVKRFRAKMSQRALADRFDFPIGGVRRILRRAGVLDTKPEQAPAQVDNDDGWPVTDLDLTEPIASQKKVPPEELIAVHVSEETLLRFAKALGVAMRSARGNRGWTRKDMRSQMNADRSLQTMATHELGTRAMSVCQFAEYCTVLDVQPGEMFDRVYHEVFGTKDETVTVDLDKLARSEHANLSRWAEVRLRGLPASAKGMLPLPRHAQDTLAALCGCDHYQLLQILSAA